MSTSDPELRAHKEWLGLLQPIGLVVTPHALVRKQAVPDRDQAVRMQARLRGLVDEGDLDKSGKSRRQPRAEQLEPEQSPPARLRDFPSFVVELLDWRASDLIGGPDAEALPDDLEVRLADLDDLLRPTYAVRSPDDPAKWLLLIQSLDAGTPLDRPPPDTGRGWHAPPQAKFERMLRELDVPIGLLHNHEALRLVYAPRGETSGHLTFPIAGMLEVPNRPTLAALHLLLGDDRLFAQSADRRLPALLHESRKYQNEVSTRLAEQVLLALVELLRGFQAADEATGGELINRNAGRDPKHVYGGLLTVLLRLVFLLYAEDRGLLPQDEVWAANYSIVGLFERLREDASRHVDTMDQRYGAWAGLVSLFRLVFAGGGHTDDACHIVIPARKGQLFDPDEYPFLEGRSRGDEFAPGERLDPPRVSDGTIFRVLRGLLILDGERLSYRALDVEQIGSVYESMMGYDIERAKGASIGVTPHHVVVDLDELLRKKAAERSKWLAEHANCKVSASVQKQVADAKLPADLVAALQRRISARTPNILPPGSLYLQPGEERRRTGSHYTPRSLTEPIVRTTLRPILEDLGPAPTETQILALKVCDPAMGSGAFLVEACRQLAEQLKLAWDRHGTQRSIPADEEPLLHAQRLVAEHCLYGVDKNPFAVNLAKLSLWLATLAKNHPFTFLDHALKCGDSLVGLTRGQIAEFRWDDQVRDDGPLFKWVREAVVRAIDARTRIGLEGEDADAAKRAWHRTAEEELADARLQGDAVIAAFFGAEKDKEREKLREVYWGKVQRWREGDVRGRYELEGIVAELHAKGVRPFHWEIEFPEVFEGDSPGFDASVANPPFIGGTLIGGRLGLRYHEALTGLYAPATGLADLVAFFLRRAFEIIRRGGAFGLVATNTVSQGDTRCAGLEQILRREGVIYQALLRSRWPGEAAVIVSLLYVAKAHPVDYAVLDGVRVRRISAFLLEGNVDVAPTILSQNKGRCFRGAKPWGAGFVFENPPADGSSSIDDMERLIALDPRNRDVIFSFMGGQEFNESPTQSPNRYIIDFGDVSEEAARKWPALFEIIEQRVRPVRLANKQRNYRESWWRHANRVEDASPYLEAHGRMLALTSLSKYVSVAFVPQGIIISDLMTLVLLHQHCDFAVLQSRVHEAWARFMGSTLEDRLRYTTPCFDTFARPQLIDSAIVESAGQAYYEFRGALMIRNDEGLTKTYNRFHDPDEHDPDIVKLRDLHAAMDRAVLEAYGWHDLAERATCEFQLDYEDPDEDDEDDGAARKKTKKKPWRYKWPQDFHDEVLARLLELNAVRAEQERVASESDTPKKVSHKRAKKVSNNVGYSTPLFDSIIESGSNVFKQTTEPGILSYPPPPPEAPMTRGTAKRSKS
jgi:hypothetical protein